MQSSDLHFLHGHLAVFLGLLALRLQDSNLTGRTSLSSSARSLLDELPGPIGAIKQKLDTLISNIDVFSSLYATLTGRVRREAGAVDGDGGDTDLLIRSSGPASDTAALNVVTSVAESLRALRQRL